MLMLKSKRALRARNQAAIPVEGAPATHTSLATKLRSAFVNESAAVARTVELWFNGKKIKVAIGQGSKFAAVKARKLRTQRARKSAKWSEAFRPVPQLSQEQHLLYAGFGGENFTFESVAADFIKRYGK